MSHRHIYIYIYIYILQLVSYCVFKLKGTLFYHHQTPFPKKHKCSMRGCVCKQGRALNCDRGRYGQYSSREIISLLVAGMLRRVKSSEGGLQPPPSPPRLLTTFFVQGDGIPSRPIMFININQLHQGWARSHRKNCVKARSHTGKPQVPLWPTLRKFKEPFIPGMFIISSPFGSEITSRETLAS